MGNKQGQELSPEEKQRLKDEKEREKRLQKEEKERKKLEKKEEKRRKKKKKRKEYHGGSTFSERGDDDDDESIGSSAWSEKSVGSAPGSWYHSASEPSSKRSSIYLPASAGPGYYQHECWYPGYEDSSSEKSKSPSRASSLKDTLSLRAASLERYPLGVPRGEPIEPLQKAESLNFPSATAHAKKDRARRAESNEETALIASRYEETIRFSRDRLERTSAERVALGERILTQRGSPDDRSLQMDRASPIDRPLQMERVPLKDRPLPKDRAPVRDHAPVTERTPLSDRDSSGDRGPSADLVPLAERSFITRTSLTSPLQLPVEEESVRGEKRKFPLPIHGLLSKEEGGVTSEAKRPSLDYTSDHTSVTGSIYYSADEGASLTGSVYYSATSGSELEDHADDQDILGKDRPSAPGQPEAVDREGSVLSRLAYVKVENDALLLRWDAPATDGGSPITGYIIERCEGEGSVWVRVNLVPIKDTEYAVANMTGGKEYRFRVTAENAVGASEPSLPSEPMSISTDQEATEPHFLRELRDAVAVEGQKVEFSCDIIGTPRPDITWFKDGFEVYDTRRFGFLVEGDRYTLVLREARLTDEGDIRVRATNRVGVASSQATFIVQAPPKIKLPAQYEQGLIFDTDELIRLRIPYTGRPQPQASWTHNGKQVEGGERHTVDVSEKHVTLKIAGASRTDKGLYTLKLFNPQGKDDASFFVTVTDRPDPPSAPTITDISGTALTLRWDPPRDDGGCRISNYIIEYFRVGWDVWLKAASSRITWAQLSDLIVGSEYRFRIKAENAYGVSEAGGESQQVLIEDAKSTEGSFESETFKSAAAAGPSVPKETVTLLQGESYSFDMEGSGDSSAVGSFDAGEGPVTSRARFLSQGTSDEQAPSVASSGDHEWPASLRNLPSFEIEVSRGPSLEAASSEERGRSFEASSEERGRSFDIESSVERGHSFDIGSSVERGQSFDVGSSVERGQSFDVGSSVERGQSFDVGSSVERGYSFEIGSSLERGASYDMQSSLDRGPSFDSEIIRNKPDAFQWDIAEELSQSESLGKEVSIEITGSDGLPVSAKYNLAASVERGSPYEDEHLLRAAEYLGGPAGGSLDLGSSAGESMDLGGSFESIEPPKVPPRSPRRASPRSPADQPSPMPGPPSTATGVVMEQKSAPAPPPRSRPTESHTSAVSEVPLQAGDSGAPHPSCITIREEGEMAPPTPPPRSHRSGSRASVGTDSSLLGDAPSYHVLGAEGGCELAPTPPPRSRRSGSRASTVSELSALEIECGMELAPTPPPRARRPGSRSSITSESSALGWSPTPARRKKRRKTEADVEMAEGAESPIVPPRSRRPGSRTSQVSQASTVTSETQFEAEPFVRATPPPSDVADIASAQAAPVSTPSSEILDALVTPRMEAVTVVAGGEAVLAVSLDNVHPTRITWQKGGRVLEAGPHYTTTQTQRSAQLVIHDATAHDSGTYTAVVNRRDGTQARAKVSLKVENQATVNRVEAPVFVRTLSDQSAKVGTRVRFLVELRHAHDDVKVFWYHNNVEVSQEARYRVLHEGNFYCLDISPLNVSDEGSWKCVAENTSGQASSSSSFKVIVPKGYRAPVFLEALEALLTDEGTVSLECKVVGIPTPVLKWFKDGVEIKAGDVFALTANANDPTSLGTYTCEASNCMGQAVSSSRVKVVSRDSSLLPPARKEQRSPTPIGPPPVLVDRLVDHKVKVGEKTRFTVKVETPPEVQSVSWYHNGQKVEPNDHYRLSDEGGGRHLLEITPTELGDDGDWKAVVKNEGGYTTSVANLTLSVPRNYRAPRFLDSLKALLTEEGLVSFECKVVGYPTPTLQWFKDGQELKPGDVYQLSGTNSLGKYSCIAKNCMGEAQSLAELTLEDIKAHLNEEEKEQLLATNIPPRFIQGLRSRDVKIGDPLRLTVQVTVTPAPSVTWYHEDEIIAESSKYRMNQQDSGIFHLDIDQLEMTDQGEWKCVASNDYGHSVTATSVKLVIPRHYKKPVFLESLRAVLSQEGTVNLECKVIGVPQPVLKWYKDGVELQPGDIHRIISGEDGTCCLGTYTCEATNIMGSASSSASLLGFEDKLLEKEKSKVDAAGLADLRGIGIARNPSLSTINEERSSQISMYESAMSEASVPDDERADVSVSIDGKEISLSLYDTPDISEAEAKQIAEIYADEISDHISANETIQAELPPLRFTRETSCKGPLLMEAMVIDVENEAFEEYMTLTDIPYDDARTEADVEELSPLEALVVEEKEALRSDIADLSDMETWEEETLSAHTVDPEGKAVAQVNKQNVLQHDLRTLSEQGISMLQEQGEIKQVLAKGKVAIVEEPQVMSAAAKTFSSEEHQASKAEAQLLPELNVAQKEEQAAGLQPVKTERKQAKRSIEAHEAAVMQEQQVLSEEETLSDMTKTSKVSAKQANQVLQEALEVASQEAVEQAKSMESEERPSKKARKTSIKKVQDTGEAATVQIPEVCEAEGNIPSTQQVQHQQAKEAIAGQEGYKVESVEVMEDIASLETKGVSSEHAKVKEGTKKEAVMMGTAEVIIDDAPKALKLEQAKAQKAQASQVPLTGVAQQQQQQVLIAGQNIPQSQRAEESEAELSDFHSVLEPMQLAEQYGLEYAEAFEALTPEQQMALQIDPSYREALIVAIREGHPQIGELSQQSIQEAQAYPHHILHEAIESYEQMGMSGDFKDISEYMRAISDRAQILTETAREAVMVQEPDVDDANLHVFSKEDMSSMLTVAEEKSGSLAEYIVVQEPDLQSEAAIVSQRPAAHPERAVAGIVEGAAESATIGEPPVISEMGKLDKGVTKDDEKKDKKRPASQSISADEKRVKDESQAINVSQVDSAAAKKGKLEEGTTQDAEAAVATVGLTPEQIQSKKEELLAKLENLRAKQEAELCKTPSTESLTSESIETEELKKTEIIDESIEKKRDEDGKDSASKKRKLSAEQAKKDAEKHEKKKTEDIPSKKTKTSKTKESGKTEEERAESMGADGNVEEVTESLSQEEEPAESKGKQRKKSLVSGVKTAIASKVSEVKSAIVSIVGKKTETAESSETGGIEEDAKLHEGTENSLEPKSSEETGPRVLPNAELYEESSIQMDATVALKKKKAEEPSVDGEATVSLKKANKRDEDEATAELSLDLKTAKDEKEKVVKKKVKSSDKKRPSIKEEEGKEDAKAKTEAEKAKSPEPPPRKQSSQVEVKPSDVSKDSAEADVEQSSVEGEATVSLKKANKHGEDEATAELSLDLKAAKDEKEGKVMKDKKAPKMKEEKKEEKDVKKMAEEAKKKDEEKQEGKEMTEAKMKEEETKKEEGKVAEEGIEKDLKKKKEVEPKMKEEEEKKETKKIEEPTKKDEEKERGKDAKKEVKVKEEGVEKKQEKKKEGEDVKNKDLKEKEKDKKEVKKGEDIKEIKEEEEKKKDLKEEENKTVRDDINKKKKEEMGKKDQTKGQENEKEEEDDVKTKGLKNKEEEVKPKDLKKVEDKKKEEAKVKTKDIKKEEDMKKEEEEIKKEEEEKKKDNEKTEVQEEDKKKEEVRPTDLNKKEEEQVETKGLKKKTGRQ